MSSPRHSRSATRSSPARRTPRCCRTIPAAGCRSRPTPRRSRTRGSPPSATSGWCCAGSTTSPASPGCRPPRRRCGSRSTTRPTAWSASASAARRWASTGHSSSPIFDAARAAGLHSVPHAGETTGPETIWTSLRDLGAERIGHGTSAAQDPALLAHLAAEGIAARGVPVVERGHPRGAVARRAPAADVRRGRGRSSPSTPTTRRCSAPPSTRSTTSPPTCWGSTRPGVADLARAAVRASWAPADVQDADPGGDRLLHCRLEHGDEEAPMRVTRWTRTSALVAASALLMVTAGCSDDSSGSEDGDDDADASSESSDLESPDAYDCVLSSSAIGDVTGFDFTGVEPNGGSIGGSHGSLTWDGCEYETDGDATVELSVIVDENGEPDVASYDAFEADALESDDADPAGDTEIGEGSFFDLNGGLYVRTADSTLHFSLISSDAGDPPPEDLEAIALGVLEASGSESDCESLPGQVPAGYLPQDDVSTGTTSDGTIDFITCRFPISIGGPDGVVVGPGDRLQRRPRGVRPAHRRDRPVRQRRQGQGRRHRRLGGPVPGLAVLQGRRHGVRRRGRGRRRASRSSIEVLEEIALAVVDDAGDPDATDATVGDRRSRATTNRPMTRRPTPAGRSRTTSAPTCRRCSTPSMGSSAPSRPTTTRPTSPGPSRSSRSAQASSRPPRPTRRPTSRWR